MSARKSRLGYTSLTAIKKCFQARLPGGIYLSRRAGRALSIRALQQLNLQHKNRKGLSQQNDRICWTPLFFAFRAQKLTSGALPDNSETGCANILNIRRFQMEEEIIVRKDGSTQIIRKTVKEGISFGTALAMVISFVTWKSIGWAIVHGLLGWVYVIYYMIRY